MREEQFIKWLLEDDPKPLSGDSPTSYVSRINSVEKVTGNLDNINIDNLENTLSEINAQNFENEITTLKHFKSAIRKYWKFREATN
jgi:hypothetical protein